MKLQEKLDMKDKRIKGYYIYSDKEKYYNDLINIAKTTLSSKLVTHEKELFSKIINKKIESDNKDELNKISNYFNESSSKKSERSKLELK